MATLLQRRLSVLRGLGLALTLVGLCLPAARAADTDFMDAVVAELDGAAVTASDIALARALGLFDLRPSSAPIDAAEANRYLDARLVEGEAVRLGIQGSPDEMAAAWKAAAARVGGMAALTAWLDRNGIDAAWARRLIAEDLRRERYIELRFRTFAFVSEADVDAALGSGPHAPEERLRTRRKLTDEAMQRSLSQWLSAARREARIRLVPQAIPSPLPFPMPGGPATPSAHD